MPEFVHAHTNSLSTKSLTFISPHSTYYDRRLRQGPALIRARRPYLFKNAVTGLGLLAVVSGICMLAGVPVANMVVHNADLD